MKPASICAWCQKVMKKGDMATATHGICPQCYRKLMKEVEEHKRKERRE